MEIVLEYLSGSLKSEIQKYLFQDFENVEEIRIRVNRPIAIKLTNEIKILEHIVTVQEILETFQKVCENSVYSYKKQICEGFITIKNGHRVGITGNCVIENGQVININYISSLNFRIAREQKGCSNKILKYIIDKKNNEIYNTLIVSKPGCGKTTILRDIIRNISNNGKTCGLVDERGEIAAMHKGIPQNDVGILTDVIDNISKSKGMTMLIRSMAPEIIACDEIGSFEDIQAINYAVCSGVKGIFTAHGNSLEELFLNPHISELLKKYIIERIIFLSQEYKGKFDSIYYLENKNYLKSIIDYDLSPV